MDGTGHPGVGGEVDLLTLNISKS
ncbi:MAG: hypothetical protein QOE59_3284, partial [Actinomycetota bacterium]|nr:hypothetical protein [Actinomycetota bacterium]